MDTPLKQEWRGQDAFLIGGGSSLTHFDFTRLKGKNTIGCNDAFRLGPEIVKFCIFGDAGWWHRNKWDLEKFTNPLVTCAPALAQYQIPNCIKLVRERDGLHEPPKVGWNYSTGAFAINFAISLGAVRIFLLGYDLATNNGKSHWHSGHRLAATQEYSYHRFLKGFNALKKAMAVKTPNVRVLNVTDGLSKLDCFQKITFEEFGRTL